MVHPLVNVVVNIQFDNSHHSPLDLPLIICNIHHYISTMLETLLTTGFTIIFIAIFFTRFHYQFIILKYSDYVFTNATTLHYTCSRWIYINYTRTCLYISLQSILCFLVSKSGVKLCFDETEKTLNTKFKCWEV